jgi:3-deoxy-manno-octulosonate cytidylyltransferase (CMP-KDO synthetase)
MPAIAVIPARYESSRFPGKPLAFLLGKPLIQHVYERAKQANCIQEVFVATDNKLICESVESFGGKAVMTSDKHQSGTDRIAEAMIRIGEKGFAVYNTDVVVNIQGDEPLIMPEMIEAVVLLMEDERAAIGTLARKIQEPREVLNPNVVKVVTGNEGFALFFSRCPIPYHRDIMEGKGLPLKQEYMCNIRMFKHIGIYAYRKAFLERFSQLSPGVLEQAERLEQLRALEHGYAVKVGETEYDTIGVDTPEDLEQVKKCLSIFS